MSATLLLDEFPLVARAPNGIGRIRELVHYFALSGGLSERRNGDSTAAEVVEDALLKKEEYFATSRTRRGSRKHAALIDVVRIHPSHWEVTDAGNLLDLINGRAFKSTEWSKSGKPIIRIQNLNDPNAPFNYFLGDAEERHQVQDGDMLLSWSGTPGTSFGAFIWDRGDAVLNQHIFKVAIFSELLDKRYLQLAINACLDVLIGSARGGVGLKHVTKGQIEAMRIPLPPLEEQKRIVAKVDELMGLCDRLESQLAERAKLLPLLSQANHARFIEEPTEENLKIIFHDLGEVCSDDMRQTILSLAVRGLLTSEDDSGQTAADLLGDIENVRKNHADPNLKKTDNAVRPLKAVDKPFLIPKSWAWVRSADLCWPISSGTTPPKSVFTGTEGIPYLKVYNIRDQRVDFEYKPQFIDRDFHQQKMKRSILTPGTVIMNIVGPPLGKVAVVPDTYDEWNCNQAIAFFRSVIPNTADYLYWYLCEGGFLNAITLIGTAGQDNISVTKCKNIPIPLPSINEQQEIVSRVQRLTNIVARLQKLNADLRVVEEQMATATVSTLSSYGPTESKNMKLPGIQVLSNLACGTPVPVGVIAPLASILNGRQMSAKDLWLRSGLEIESFYRQLKTEIANDWIAEPEPAKVEEVEAD